MNARMESVTATPARPPLGAAAMTVVAICWLAYFLDGLVHTIMGPLAPGVAATLGLVHAQLGPIFSANLIGQCFGLISLPFAARRTGHRAIATRYLGDDARWDARPGTFIHKESVRESLVAPITLGDGDEVESRNFPKCWPIAGG